MGVVRRAARTAAHYLRYHPRTLITLGRHAAGRRVGIPLDVLRWAADQLPVGGGRPESLVLTARPPALAVDATLSLMGDNRLKVSVAIEVESVTLGPDTLQVALRLHGLEVTPLTPKSPLGKMLSSGFLDFNNPASVLNLMPKRPRVIAEASGNRFVLNLLALRALKRDRRLRRALATLSPVLQIPALRTEGDWLVAQLAASPSGLLAALEGLRAPLSHPS